ncbi:MAG: peptidylprolyl isomerase [Chloroherpetonaceae bacterium]|nr:peptidylprolyl isomerase [Chthonomonadaceae bacterium]MDW8208947.1 peptidylprolyl isomerase [Chloroherpetonaceae bacterium]
MPNRTAVLETTQGIIRIELFEDRAPITTHNFVDLVERGFYDGLTFHRYEPGFVVQGGCPLGTGTGGFVDAETRKERRIPLEVTPELRHDAAGVVAMARTAEPNSASSQFYITLQATPFLDMQYAVFGKVTEGLENVMRLRRGDRIHRARIESARE